MLIKFAFLLFPKNNLTCLSALNDDVMLWHKRLGYASFSLLNKLVLKDLVVGLPSTNTMMTRYVMFVLEENKSEILLN